MTSAPDAAGPSIVRGTNDKPAASDSLVNHFATSATLDGQLFIGYPIIGTSEGKRPIDAVWVSPTRGILVFDLVEGTEIADFRERQDDAARTLQSRLLTHRSLVHRRELTIRIHALTYCPGAHLRNLPTDAEYPVANSETLDNELDRVTWTERSVEIYERAISAIQSISTIRRARSARDIQNESSRGARLQKLEESIATLDNLQGKAVIETVEGVQRIRGLAGSGKTIVLALKAAYLHAQHPEWRMAVTFNTRSLKGHFRRLINNFSIEQTGEEPDWDNVRIINGWGGSGGPTRDGIYHEFCIANGVEFLDFGMASRRYGRVDGFKRACAEALAKAPDPAPLYDVILVDEAQDFPPEFLRLCYLLLNNSKRLVYAYDELQNLLGTGMPPAEDIFGRNADGSSKVSFDHQSPVALGAHQDIILEKCYRNSRPVLVTAHALGFGMYRKKPKGRTTGLVQIFDEPSLWTDIGYRVESGTLAPGQDVILRRVPETSPLFLEEHSTVDDLVSFRLFDSAIEQDQWIANQIAQNLTQDELRHDDIVVINTDPVTTRGQLGPVRKALLDRKIMSHLAGVETSADVFFQPEADSVTFTGIFRAKGNEAAMVYVANAQECHSEHSNLAQLRNRLFTAITRSKAWVRVTGFGANMEVLMAEFDELRSNEFQLRFTYPTEAEQAQLQIVHRDRSAAERRHLRKKEAHLGELIDDLEAGRVLPDELPEELVDRLSELLRRDRP